jgi:hypothetical protein
MTFHHTYNGVTTGVSTRRDVCRLLRFPLWKFFYWPLRKLIIWWEPHPRHKGVEIRLSKHDGKVDIIALRVAGYADLNGIRIGGPWSQIDRIPVKRIGSGIAIDEANGVLYHSVTYKREVDVIVLKRSW